MMRTLVFEPGYCPYEAFFKNAEDATAKVIRGEHDTLLPFGNDVIALVCSKAQQEQPPNRTIDEKTVIHVPLWYRKRGDCNGCIRLLLWASGRAICLL